MWFVLVWLDVRQSCCAVHVVLEVNATVEAPSARKPVSQGIGTPFRRQKATLEGRGACIELI